MRLGRRGLIPLFSVLCGLLAVGLLLAWTDRAAADPGTLFVRPDGAGSACAQAQPCALQTALSQAVGGDVLVLASGTYVGSGAAVVTLTESIGIFGGWDGAASGPVVRDPELYPSTLDGQGQRRVVHISGQITPTLSDVTIANGNASGLTDLCYAASAGDPDGCGGGIFVYQANALIAHTVITNNVASTASQTGPYGITGYGGGIYIDASTGAQIVGNTIISNVGSLAAHGAGGGVFLYQCRAGTEVTENQILSNTATMSTTAGWGGGIHLAHSDTAVLGNWVQGNAASAGWSQGSGIYQWYGAPTLLGNMVIGNRQGEAVYLGHSEAHVEGNRVLQNDTTSGVYLLYGAGNGVTLVNNWVAGNGTYNVYIGSSATNPLTATLMHNTIAGATYGVYLAAHSRVEMVNTIVAGHTWGITNTFAPTSTVGVDHTVFWANTYDGIRGAWPIDGDPAFVNPADGDYHIGPRSVAIDAGVDLGVPVDIDGDARPYHAWPDVGADEAMWADVKIYLYVPLVTRSHEGGE
jgi:Periplasmic copper-binding protein (NosD)